MSKRRIVAGLGAVALALAACQGGVEGQTGAPSVPELPSEMPSLAPPSGLESLVPSPSSNQLFPVFQAQGGANLTGGAIITDVDGESSVVIGVVAPGAAEMLPAAIVEGDCASQTGQGPTPPPELFPSPAASGEAGASPGAAESPAGASPEASAGASPGGTASFPLWLTPVAVGSSNSVIPVGVEDLVAAPHAIIIETSPEDPTLLACADLQEGPPTPASPGASAPAASPGGDLGSSPGTSPGTSP